MRKGRENLYQAKARAPGEGRGLLNREELQVPGTSAQEETFTMKGQLLN